MCCEELCEGGGGLNVRWNEQASAVNGACDAQAAQTRGHILVTQCHALTQQATTPQTCLSGNISVIFAADFESTQGTEGQGRRVQHPKFT